MGLAHNASIVRSGLVLYLDAANRKSYPGSGTAWTDLSGNGNNGTLTNGPTFNSANGGSIVFDGIDDYVKFGSSIQPSIITVSLWLKPDSIMLSGGYKCVIDKSSSWYLFLFNSTPRFFINGDSNYAESTVNLSTSWCNVVGTYDLSTIKIYVNGVQTGLTAYTTAITQNNFPIELMSRSTVEGKGNNYKSVGNISLNKIYNRALTAAEVRQNFEAHRDRYGI